MKIYALIDAIMDAINLNVNVGWRRRRAAAAFSMSTSAALVGSQCDQMVWKIRHIDYFCAKFRQLIFWANKGWFLGKLIIMGLEWLQKFWSCNWISLTWPFRQSKQLGQKIINLVFGQIWLYFTIQYTLKWTNYNNYD